MPRGRHNQERPASPTGVAARDENTFRASVSRTLPSLPVQFVKMTLLESRKVAEVLSYLPQGEWATGAVGSAARGHSTSGLAGDLEM